MGDVASALMMAPRSPWDPSDEDRALLEALSPGGQRAVTPAGPSYLRALGQYANDKFVSPFFKAATAPGDAYSGNMQVMDPATGMPSQEAVDRSRDLAMNMTLGSAAAPNPGTVSMGMKAYHGSPHDFERFDMSKIGTGEGAQVYGHGLYFAENEGVAKSYREKLTNEAPNVYLKDRKIELGDGETPEQFAASALLPDGNPKAAADRIRSMIEFGGGDKEANDFYRQGLKHLEDNAEHWRVEANPGRMYQVDINADPSHFLDWDKPFSEQNQTVQNALMAMPGAERYGLDASSMPLGEKIRRGLLPLTYDHTSDTFSRGYHEAGIPGIKYLDAGSRGAGDGSRNYVVFDDSLVSILKKYGWVPGAAIPAAAMGEVMKAQQGQGQSPFYKNANRPDA